MQTKDILRIAVQFVQEIVLHPTLDVGLLETMSNDDFGDLNQTLQIVPCANGFLIQNQGQTILGTIKHCGTVYCYLDLDSRKYFGPCELWDDSPQTAMLIFNRTMATLLMNRRQARASMYN